MINHMKKFDFKKKKVIVAMSGGVDSSVSALLLKKKYYVEGLFMKNWEEDDKKKYCKAKKDLQDAKKVCKKLKIRLHKINFSSEYWDKVFKVFLKEQKKGYTPNPDILCNKEIKFKLFLKYSLKYLNADYIATGHYAKKKILNKRYFLCKSKDKKKDQTYFLYLLTERKLKKILFPLGNLKKKIVRKIAKKNNLHISNKKSSTGICFIEPKSFKKFLKKYIPSSPGKIITTKNKVIGIHKGLFNYTIGQRKGLKIGGCKKYYNMPWYVVDKKISKNLLVVAQGFENFYLMNSSLIAINVHWINNNYIRFPLKCTAKIRYLQKEIFCTVKNIKNKTIKVNFNKKIFAITPGQSIVFYYKKICLGGAKIYKNLNNKK